MSGRTLALLILAASAVRLAAAASVGLGVDESYMVAAGRVWHWSYFDHPPLAWWLSHGAASLFGSEAPVVVRLPFIALSALSTWLLFALTARTHGRAAAGWAAICFTLAPVLSLSGGSWVLPDGPAECALLAAALALTAALEGSALRWWLAAGAAAGFALLSKYTAALVLLGALIFLLTDASARRHWRTAGPWAGLLVALGMQAPVLIWNARHGWASLAFQGGRASVIGLHPLAPLLVLAGEAAFMLPWIWLPCMVGLWRAARGPRRGADWFFACLGAPAVLGFALVALWSPRVLFHWAAPGYLLLLPLAGAVIAARAPRLPRWIAQASAGFVLLALAGLAMASRLGWPPLIRAADIAQIADWRGLAPALGLRGEADLPVAGLRWFDCGKIGYGLGPDRALLCLTDDPRQFAYSTDPAAFAGRDILILAPRTSPADAARRLAGRFERVETLPPLLLPLGMQRLAIPAYRGIGFRPDAS